MSFPDFKAEDPDMVRISDFSTKWKISAVKPNLTQVELISYADPKGLPILFVNMSAVESCKKSLMTLKTLMETP